MQGQTLLRLLLPPTLVMLAWLVATRLPRLLRTAQLRAELFAGVKQVIRAEEAAADRALWWQWLLRVLARDVAYVLGGGVHRPRAVRRTRAGRWVRLGVAPGWWPRRRHVRWAEVHWPPHAAGLDPRFWERLERQVAQFFGLDHPGALGQVDLDRAARRVRYARAQVVAVPAAIDYATEVSGGDHRPAGRDDPGAATTDDRRADPDVPRNDPGRAPRLRAALRGDLRHPSRPAPGGRP